jgi:hypothetical protein
MQAGERAGSVATAMAAFAGAGAAAHADEHAGESPHADDAARPPRGGASRRIFSVRAHGARARLQCALRARCAHPRSANVQTRKSKQ